jgi:hypothetical protein
VIGFVTRFESELLTATPRPERRRARRSSLVAVLAGLAVAAPTLAATQPWKPLLGDDRRGTPASSVQAPPAEQLAGLGVLRRPQSDDDRGQLAEQALRLTDSNVDGVRTGSVRTLSSPATDAVLIPVERFNLQAAKFLPPDAPASMRNAFAVKHDGICLFVPDPAGDGGGTGCNTWDELRQGTLPSRIGPIYYGVVPDGVARVTIRTDIGSLDAPVRENFFAARSEQASADRPTASALGVDWIDAAGNVTHSVAAPTAADSRPPDG